MILGRSAQQRLRVDPDRIRVVPVAIHGDAAFPGQGVVSECFNMMKLDGYDVGGTIHLVVNNQVGFTTDPHDTFSGRYCTDLAKMVESPICTSMEMIPKRVCLRPTGVGLPARIWHRCGD